MLIFRNIWLLLLGHGVYIFKKFSDRIISMDRKNILEITVIKITEWMLKNTLGDPNSSCHITNVVWKTVFKNIQLLFVTWIDYFEKNLTIPIMGIKAKVDFYGSVRLYLPLRNIWNFSIYKSQFDFTTDDVLKFLSIKSFSGIIICPSSTLSEVFLKSSSYFS